MCALFSVVVLLVYSTALNIVIAARCHTNANMISELRIYAHVAHVYIREYAVGTMHAPERGGWVGYCQYDKLRTNNIRVYKCVGMISYVLINTWVYKCVT